MSIPFKIKLQKVIDDKELFALDTKPLPRFPTPRELCAEIQRHYFPKYRCLAENVLKQGYCTLKQYKYLKGAIVSIHEAYRPTRDCAYDVDQEDSGGRPSYYYGNMNN
jgi:hypothetical protein